MNCVARDDSTCSQPDTTQVGVIFDAANRTLPAHEIGKLYSKCHLARICRGQREHAAAGLARNATYLLRPDTYVALADPPGAPEALERYCIDREIRTLSVSR